jgi:hypothetical protein
MAFLSDMETLAKKPIYSFRSQAGAFKVEGGFFKTGRTGLPDISLIVNGKYIGIEVKAPGKKQSAGQVTAEKEIHNAGGEYWVVSTVLQVKTILSKHIDIF